MACNKKSKVTPPPAAPGAGAPDSGSPPAAGASASGKLVGLVFLKPWSSDRGYFAPGAKASLPSGIAASLIKEGVAEAAD